jgi:transcriptional regulator with XRE-family HTH domain
VSWQERSMEPTDFVITLIKLNLDQAKCARFLGISERTTRRYVRGETAIPPAHALLLRAMVRFRVTPIVPMWTREQN